MAENIFVRGGFKKLREENRKYEQAVAELGKKISEYQQRELNFQNAKFETMAEKIQEQYYLTKEKILLKTARQNLQNTKKFLESESERLERICQTEEARQKISVIAAGILKKNIKVEEEYERAKIHSKDLSQKLKLAKKRLKGLEENGSRKLQNYSFSMAQLEKDSATENDPNFVVDLIADTLNGNETAVQLVAYCSDNSLEMDKMWSLMSELDKDALLHKLAMRDL